MEDTKELVRFGTLPAADKRRVVRSAFLRPTNVLVVVLGVLASVLLSWWFLPVAAVTYSLLVLLASRDPFFIRRVVGESGDKLNIGSSPANIQPERRARWLPRGETREKVEKSLEIYRDIVVSIEGSNDVTREVLDDAIPKLHSVADRLVDIAHSREKAVATIRETKEASASDGSNEENVTILGDLENEVRRIDAEIVETLERLVNLRSRIAYASITDPPAGHATAAELGRSLDNMSLRLEALGSTARPPESELRGE